MSDHWALIAINLTDFASLFSYANSEDVTAGFKRIISSIQIEANGEKHEVDISKPNFGMTIKSVEDSIYTIEFKGDWTIEYPGNYEILVTIEDPHIVAGFALAQVARLVTWSGTRNVES